MINEFLIRCESDDAIDTCTASFVDGLPPLCRLLGDESSKSFLISIESKMGDSLRNGNFYTISKLVGDLSVHVATIFCQKAINVSGVRQYYLAEVRFSDLQAAHLLEAWSDGVAISWRELDSIYGYSWLTACMRLSSAAEWIQPCKNYEIFIDTQGLRTIEDFYCYLGEELFGYKGYAGRDLDGFFEILTKNDLTGLIFNILNERDLADFFFATTRRSDYLELFESALLDSGVRLKTSR